MRSNQENSNLTTNSGIDTNKSAFKSNSFNPSTIRIETITTNTSSATDGNVNTLTSTDPSNINGTKRVANSNTYPKATNNKTWRKIQRKSISTESNVTSNDASDVFLLVKNRSVPPRLIQPRPNFSAPQNLQPKEVKNVFNNGFGLNPCSLLSNGFGNNYYAGYLGDFYARFGGYGNLFNNYGYNFGGYGAHAHSGYGFNSGYGVNGGYGVNSGYRVNNGFSNMYTCPYGLQFRYYW